MRFSGKKVFVTGASRGIGRAIAAAFKSEGAHVIGTRTRDPGQADDTCHEWITADFSSVGQIKECADAVRAAKPDVLVNNVGINKIGPFIEIDPADFLAIQQVNVFAPFLLCQAAIPAMKTKGWGRIVNVSSIWGKVSREYRASYSTSKFAIDGMTLALAAEHSADGILANSIAPGVIDTELTRRVLGESGIKSLVSGVPVRRLGRAEEIARLVLWLTSDENTYLTGQNVAIDGGFSRV
ncbi:MAG: family oxidoreductase [Betaproteobacteria bacterium]|nr:family oxidoreductase [Betaproteobacteria bacterium]